MNLTSAIESLLFVSPRPLTIRKLAEVSGGNEKDVTDAVQELTQAYNTSDRGIQIVAHGTNIQMVTSPLNSRMITQFLKEEQAGELTRPALETLTIVAYRGPISKIQLDTIRGVNCALILRNLMIKGLVEAKTHKDKHQTSYQVTMEYIRYLGLNRIEDLPEYERLHTDENLERLLNPEAAVIKEEVAPPAV